VNWRWKAIGPALILFPLPNLQTTSLHGKGSRKEASAEKIGAAQ